ncbi:MAG: SoxR reducing system RseC family protein [Oscillospiraceae bacterium]|nr:SoxR reducing system RseC family protein [Clostridiales bacterium]MDY2961647.1 SoxR reducing system RseC family protein [Oscillospiraceae bacterium]MDD6078302.1 SoxR reducing system RseC family protein [Clostridiales bacterium]MDD6107510.1 SoxR reducing system RseC family protein [Clostridiales bacterium]MDD6935834.1 SoxR reducing system RseC family protein [Clostridiales bacterium]
MTQDAVVTKLIDKRTAEVEVERGTACGGNCGSCEACVFQNKIRTTARNRISALPGQKVVIETKTSDILGAAALLYLVPFVLLFIGYAIGAALSFGQGGCILVGVAFFALGVALNVLLQRRKNKTPITFEIIQIRE